MDSREKMPVPTLGMMRRGENDNGTVRQLRVGQDTLGGRGIDR